MKGPIPGLADYKKRAGSKARWHGYRRRAAGGRRYRKLVETLADLQHGLCGYCEIDLLESDRQVEHVVPRSDPTRGEALALVAANMIACCLGGASDVAEVRLDRERAAPKGTSCGQEKGNESVPEFVDPRTLPALPSLMRVRSDGRIEADASACEAAGRSASDVQDTVEVLNLNVPRLKRARKDYWDNLMRMMREYQGDSNAMRRWAQSTLLPRHGSLHKFFTTSRSYFGRLGESILAAKPRDWI